MSPEFNDNNRRKQELAMRPAIDAIYAKMWPGCTIKRYEHADEVILDRKHAIDVEITLPTGMILLGQEKALSHEYSRYRTVTVEYQQNPQTGEKGDWFHLAPQFYFCGYSTVDQKGLAPWVLLDWPRMALLTLADKVPWQGPRDNSKTAARANFKFVKMDAIPPDCIIASEGLIQQSKLVPVPIKSERQQVKELIAGMTLAELSEIIGEVLTSKVGKAA